MMERMKWKVANMTGNFWTVGYSVLLVLDNKPKMMHGQRVFKALQNLFNNRR